MTTTDVEQIGHCLRCSLGDEVKMVRGIWYCDGVPYRRWIPAYEDNGTWFGHDDAEIISDVDAVLEMSQLDELVPAPWPSPDAELRDAGAGASGT